MKYTPKVRRAIFNSSQNVRVELAEDFYYLYLEHINGSRWRDIETKFIFRMFLHDIGDWTYWGGSKIVEVDKEDVFPISDTNWTQKIQSAYEWTANITNRKVFGRRYFKKFQYPISIVFPEKGKGSKGKHIHTIFHFPNKTIDKANQYLHLFSEYWNIHETNRDVGRDFWWEPVKDAEKSSRYVSKKMTSDDYEMSWFPVF